MAFIILRDQPAHRRYKTVSHETGVLLFNVQQGLIEATPELKAKAAKVKRVYLPFGDAPIAYQKLYGRKDTIEPVLQPRQYRD